MAIPPGMGQNQRQFCDALKEEIKRELDPVVDETVEQVAVAALEGSKQSVKTCALSSIRQRADFVKQVLMISAFNSQAYICGIFNLQKVAISALQLQCLSTMHLL